MSLENPIFGPKESEKKSFTEIKQESGEDYDSFLKGVQEKVASVKQATRRFTDMPLRVMKTSAEKLVKSAITMRNIKEYGFLRLGKETAADTAGKVLEGSLDVAGKAGQKGVEIGKKGWDLAKRGREALSKHLEKRKQIVEVATVRSEEKIKPISDQYQKYIQLIKLAGELGLKVDLKISGQVS